MNLKEFLKMYKLTEKEQIILQKLIRQEKSFAFELPHLDESYVSQLDVLYKKVGYGEDHWEGY
jgi:hypothetical protein